MNPRITRRLHTVAVERALSPRTWLLFDLDGNYGTQSATGQRDTSGGYASLTAGVRRVVSEGGVVDLSVWGGASGSWSANDYDLTSGVNLTLERWHTAVRAVGLSAGIAVDRRLLDALSLRLSLGMLHGSYAWTRIERTGNPTVEGHSLQGGFALRPTLLLRIAI